MFCPKCGKELPDNSKFCNACGERLADPIPMPQETSDTSPIPVSAVSVDVPETGFVPQNKKAVSNKVIGIAAAAIVLIAAILGVCALLGSGSKNAYAYISDGKYQLISELDSDQSIEIDSSKSEDVHSLMLSFSRDGKYIYYYTKYDSDSGTGTLCRAEYGRLKADSAKNDKYIQVIAKNVSLGFQMLEDGTIAYRNSDGDLYCFDGEESVRIAKDVSRHSFDSTGRVVYATGNSTEGYTLYGALLNDPDFKTKLASNCADICTMADFENILYTKIEEDGSKSLYVVGFEKESEKLAEQVSILPRFSNMTFFTAANGSTLSLYS